LFHSFLFVFFFHFSFSTIFPSIKFFHIFMSYFFICFFLAIS
jgi:hypothetical protein